MPEDFNLPPSQKQPDRPPPVQLPDIAAWKAKHGLSPYILPDSHGPLLAGFAIRARNLCIADFEADSVSVHDTQEELAFVGREAGSACGLSEDTRHVFYDASRGNFMASASLAVGTPGVSSRL